MRMRYLAGISFSLLFAPLLLLALDKDIFFHHVLPLQGKILYWINPCLIVLSLLPLYFSRRILGEIRIRSILPHLVIGLLSSAILLAIVNSICPERMRVQWDETSIVATSQRMYLAHRAEYVAESTLENGGIRPISLIADKRPPLFPFFVSMLHQFRGMSIANAFLLNRIVFALFLFSLFLFFSIELGLPAGIAAQFLFLSTPLVSISASTAGFDLFSAFLFLLSAICSWRYVRSPSFERLLWLFNIGCFFIFSRYESLFLFCVLLAASLYYTRSFWLQDKRAKTLLLFLPVAAIPIELIGIACFRYGYFQQDYQLAGASQFSLANLVRNLPYFLNEFFTLKVGNPFFGLFSIVGLIALCLVLLKRKLSIQVLPSLLATFFSLLTSLFFYAGNAADGTTARLFLPIAIAGSLSPFLLQGFFPRRAFSLVLLLLSGLSFAAQLPALNAGTILKISPTAKFAQALDMVLSAHRFHRQSLFVYDVPQFVNMEGYAAMDWPTFESKRKSLLEERAKGNIKAIYLIDMYPQNTQSPIQQYIQNLSTKRVLDFERADISLKISILE